MFRNVRLRHDRDDKTGGFDSRVRWLLSVSRRLVLLVGLLERIVVIFSLYQSIFLRHAFSPFLSFPPSFFSFFPSSFPLQRHFAVGLFVEITFVVISRSEIFRRLRCTDRESFIKVPRRETIVSRVKRARERHALRTEVYRHYPRRGIIKDLFSLPLLYGRRIGENVTARTSACLRALYAGCTSRPPFFLRVPFYRSCRSLVSRR